MPLTDVAIRHAKPAQSVFKLSDGGGLQLWINPTGAKSWCLAYRFDGKQKKLTIGPYPEIDLRAARVRRDEAKTILRAGGDPAERKRIDKLTQRASRAVTFDSLAAEVVEKKKREGKAAGTIEKFEWLLAFAKPLIGSRPIADISAAEVLAVLRKVEARGTHESAKRLRSVIGQVFRYAIASAKASNDPTFALRGALTMPKPKARAALTNAKALGGLLRAIDGYDGQPTTKAALDLMALLFPRPGELRFARWAEFDTEAAVWIIPAERMKMRREHRIPLPRQALAVLDRLKPITGNGALLLPSLRTVKRPISENTMNAALRRLGYGKDDMTPHGFRAAASTLLNESGRWSPDAVERALAHQIEDEVRRAYARGEHWDERVRMAQWWADHLDVLRSGARVIPMRAPA